MVKYYKVFMERGHTGRKRYKLDAMFYVKASNMIEAMDVAKAMPGMKHNKMPMMAREISWEEFCEGRGYNAYERCGAKGQLR